MRPTTVFTFLAASVAVLSPVIAAPVPNVDSAGTKRDCTYSECRTAELPTTDANSSQSSLTTLVALLIQTLTDFQTNNSQTNTTSIVDLSTPSPALGPVADIDINELVGTAL